MPIEPWSGGVTWQGIGIQDVNDRVPAEHVVGPLGVCLSMHEGWQEDPCGSTAGQLASVPLIGGFTTQGFGVHVLALRLPYKHVEYPLEE